MEKTVIQDYLLTNEYNAALIAEEWEYLAENGIGKDELDEYMKSMDQVYPEFMENAIQWMPGAYGSSPGLYHAGIACDGTGDPGTPG